MSKKYDAVAIVGEYEGKDGKTKKRYVNVGAVFENDKGLYMKLESLPLSRDWNGFISFFDPRTRQAEKTAETKTPFDAAPPDFDDKIPF